MTTAPATDQRRLLDLQVLDSQLARLGHQRRTLPVLATIAELEGRAQDLQRSQVEARTRVADLRRELAKAESDVELVRNRAQRHQARLDSGQGTSKDLQAIQAELEQLAGRQQALEEVELGVMEQLEDAEGEVAGIDSQLAAIEADIQAREAERDAAFTDLDAELDKVRAEREALAASLDGGLVAEYERVRARTGGLGVVGLRGTRTEPLSLDMSLTELDAIRSARPDEIVQSEDYGYIIVRLDDAK